MEFFENLNDCYVLKNWTVAAETRKLTNPKPDKFVSYGTSRFVSL
jgi:hypothetical protein